MSPNLIRYGGLAAMLSGASFIAADLLSLSISPKFPSSESLLSEPYAIQSVLKLIGASAVWRPSTSCPAKTRVRRFQW